MIIDSINKLIMASTNVQLVNKVSFGDITEYDSSSTIVYPYVNIDILESNVLSSGKHIHTFRLYSLDKNNMLSAYNKTELIITEIMESLLIDNYNIKYFSLSFGDNCSGCYVDVKMDGYTNDNCISEEQLIPDGFIITESGDYIRTEDNKIINKENE